MSALYSKDPESGIYVPEQPTRRRSGWLFAVPFVFSILGLAASAPTVSRSVSRSRPTVVVKKGFDSLLAPHSLRGAMDLFKVRGGRYHLGKNDCSTFLLDYLAGHGVRSANRQTTATLVDPLVAAHMHLLPMNEVELSHPVEQSVVVIRYHGKRNEVVGHCAVRLFQNGEPYFVHNCESAGLVVDTASAFYGRFDRGTVRDVRYYRFESGF